MLVQNTPSSPGGRRTPSPQPHVHDASQSAGLETTLQTLEASSQITDPIPQHSSSLCLSKNVDKSSQLNMKDYATPSLVSLPPEVQSMIVSFVSAIFADNLHTGHTMANVDSDQLPHLTDLNVLSRTCKTLRGASLPKLYRRVDVRIPAGHFRFDALENLLSGAGDGFKSTQQLRILPQHGPLHDNRHTNLNNDEKVEGANDYHPGSSASTLLNILIRLLISEIPLDCLQLFEYVLSFLQYSWIICPVTNPFTNYLSIKLDQMASHLPDR